MKTLLAYMLTLLSVTHGAVNLHQLLFEDDIEDLYTILKVLDKPRKLERYRSEFPQLKSFSWSDCGASGDLAKVNKLSVGPDPIDIPGNVTIGVDATLSVDLKAPVSLDLEIKKKVGLWVPIPCIDDIGSCNYEDVCQLLAQIKCPADFPIPCTCPVSKGQYNFPSASIYVRPFGFPSWLTDGDFKVRAKLGYNSKEVICIEVEASITN